MASCAALFLTSCAMVDTIDGRFDQINRSAAYARNQSILLNIVRASRNGPLNFVAVSRISGSTQAQFSAGLPSMLVGPYPIATGMPFATNAAGTALNVVEPALSRNLGLNSTTLNASTNAANSFDLTVLDSKQFYQAFLSPIDLVTMDAFIRQGYSRELLFQVFIESIRRTIAGHTVEYRNEPGAPCEVIAGQRRCFKDLIDNAMANGLTVETLAVSNNAAAKPFTAVYARMCLDPILAERFHSEHPDFKPLFDPGPGQPRCGTWPPAVKSGKQRIAETDSLNFDLYGPSGPVHVESFPRSTFGVYRFLGRILAAEATEDVRLHGTPTSPKMPAFLRLRTAPTGHASCPCPLKANLTVCPKKARNRPSAFSACWGNCWRSRHRAAISTQRRWCG
jgi:hypothetical protein